MLLMTGLASVKPDAVTPSHIFAATGGTTLPATFLNRFVGHRTPRPITMLMQKLRYSAAVFSRQKGGLSDLVVASGEEGANTSFLAAAAPTCACRNEPRQVR